jgi:cadmium resistance protein CadD (predicted permease)
VSRLLAMLCATLTTFAVTFIDDAFLLTPLYARRIPGRRIVGGQCLGFAVIVALSLTVALGVLRMPHRWAPMLGVLPLCLGIRHLIRTHRTRTDLQNEQSFDVVSVALITISNGADNVGICAVLRCRARLLVSNPRHLCSADRELAVYRN